jgi:hypothetical protein
LTAKITVKTPVWTWALRVKGREKMDGKKRRDSAKNTERGALIRSASSHALHS